MEVSYATRMLINRRDGEPLSKNLLERVVEPIALERGVGPAEIADLRLSFLLSGNGPFPILTY